MIRGPMLAAALVMMTALCATGCALYAASHWERGEAEAVAASPVRQTTPAATLPDGAQQPVTRGELAEAEVRETPVRPWPAADSLRPIPTIGTVPLREQKGAESGEQQRPPSAAPPGIAPADDGPERLIDTFEGPLLWRPIDWSNANAASIDLLDTDEGHVLSITCRPGESDKAGVGLTLKGGMDISVFGALAVDLKVEEGDGIRCALGLQGSAYFESRSVALKRGWNRGVSIPLNNPDFKTSPKWEHDSRARGLDGVRALFVVIYCPDECVAFLDNVRLVQEDAQAVFEGPSPD